MMNAAKPAKGQSATPSPDTLPVIYTKLEKYLADLKAMKEYDKAECLDIVKQISKLYWNHSNDREDIANKMADLKFPVQLVNMLKYFNQVGVFKNDDVWFPMYYTANIIWNYSDASSKLCQEFVSNGLVEIVGANISHKPYLDNQNSKNVTYILKSSLSILQNLSKSSSGVEECLDAFDQLKIKEVLHCTYLTSENEFFKTVATMIITAIISEEENKLLEDTGVIPFMVSTLKRAIANTDKRRHRGFAPQELVDCLSRMAMNDKNKMKMVEEGVLPELVKMMEYSDLGENASAAHAVWILSFDKDIREKVKAEPGMLVVLNKLKDNPEKPVRKAARGAIWTITEGQRHHENREQEEEGDVPNDHIFISYDWSNQPMVKIINERLKAAGYRTWVDIEQMGGSTLEAMAQAVENAAVVLICASERYKQSPNCRTEAEYTFQLKKEILPLMMQRRYKADGWLGMLLGAKFYINFDGKYDVDTAFDMLLKELAGRGRDAACAVDGPVFQQSQSAAPITAAVPTKLSYTKWSEKEVQKFFDEAELKHMKQHFKGCDGKLLASLRSIQSEAPDFFYRHLETKMNFSMMDIARLSAALKKL